MSKEKGRPHSNLLFIFLVTLVLVGGIATGSIIATNNMSNPVLSVKTQKLQDKIARVDQTFATNPQVPASDPLARQSVTEQASESESDTQVSSEAVAAGAATTSAPEIPKQAEAAAEVPEKSLNKPNEAAPVSFAVGQSHYQERRIFRATDKTLSKKEVQTQTSSEVQSSQPVVESVDQMSITSSASEAKETVPVSSADPNSDEKLNSCTPETLPSTQRPVPSDPTVPEISELLICEEITQANEHTETLLIPETLTAGTDEQTETIETVGSLGNPEEVLNSSTEQTAATKW